jgi:hypothetical protein
MYRYQPSTHASQLLPLDGVVANAAGWHINTDYISDVVNNYLSYLKKEWNPDQLGLLLYFNMGS